VQHWRIVTWLRYILCTDDLRHTVRNTDVYTDGDIYGSFDAHSHGNAYEYADWYGIGNGDADWYGIGNRNAYEYADGDHYRDGYTVSDRDRGGYTISPVRFDVILR
jgi:hypothetical protein